MSRFANAFGFAVPTQFDAIVQNGGTTAFRPDGPWCPWYFLEPNQVLMLHQKWPNGPCTNQLIAFARRQDCDDLAAFEVQDGKLLRILVVHGWTGGSYSIEREHEDLWSWMHSVVDDMRDFAKPD